MEVKRTCSNCGSKQEFMKREYIQLGKTGLLTGDWANLYAGALDVEIWCCPECGKMDLYKPIDEEVWDEGHIAQVTCPNCGTEHDMDDPKCPRCGAKNTTVYE